MDFIATHSIGTRMHGVQKVYLSERLLILTIRTKTVDIYNLAILPSSLTGTGSSSAGSDYGK